METITSPYIINWTSTSYYYLQYGLEVPGRQAGASPEVLMIGHILLLLPSATPICIRGYYLQLVPYLFCPFTFSLFYIHDNAGSRAELQFNPPMVVMM